MNWLEDFVMNLLCAASAEPHYMILVHDGAPARYVALDRQQQRVHGWIANPGEEMRICRHHRLIVQPLDHVRLHALCCVASGWQIQ